MDWFDWLMLIVAVVRFVAVPGREALRSFRAWRKAKNVRAEKSE